MSLDRVIYEPTTVRPLDYEYRAELREDKDLFDHLQGASSQLLKGVLKGFTTIRVGDRPEGTVEELAYSVGNLIGFIGGIGPMGRFVNLGNRGASLTASMARGTWSGLRAYSRDRDFGLAKQAGTKDFVRAQAEWQQGVSDISKRIKKGTPDWFSEPTLQFNSVPFYVADVLKRGIKSGLARVPVRVSGAENTANMMYNLNRVLPVGSRSRDTLEQAVRIGTAFGVAEWQEGPKAMVESFAMGAVFGGFDKVIANYTPLKPSGKAGQKLTDMRFAFQKKNQELRTEAAKQIARGVAGGIFNMSSSVAMGGRPELYWYDFLLGFVFGGLEISADQKRAMSFIRRAEIDYSWQDYQKLPEWEGEGRDEFGNPTEPFSDEVKFELLRHQEQKQEQMANMAVLNKLVNTGLTQEQYYDMVNEDTLNPQLRKALLDQKIITQTDVNRFYQSGRAFGPEVIKQWMAPKYNYNLEHRVLEVSKLAEVDIGKLERLLVNPERQLDEQGNLVELSFDGVRDEQAVEELSRVQDIFTSLQTGIDFPVRESSATERFKQEAEVERLSYAPQPTQKPRELDAVLGTVKEQESLLAQREAAIRPFKDSFFRTRELFELNDLSLRSFEDIVISSLRTREDVSDVDLMSALDSSMQTVWNEIAFGKEEYRNEKTRTLEEFDNKQYAIDPDREASNLYLKSDQNIRSDIQQKHFDQFYTKLTESLGTDLPVREKNTLRRKFNEAVFGMNVETVFFDVSESVLKASRKQQLYNSYRRFLNTGGTQDQLRTVSRLSNPADHLDVTEGSIALASETNIRDFSPEIASENNLSDLLNDIRYNIRQDRDTGRLGSAGYAFFGGDIRFANPESIRWDNENNAEISRNTQYESVALSKALGDSEAVTDHLNLRAERLYEDQNMILLYGLNDKDSAILVENPFRDVKDARELISRSLLPLRDDLLRVSEQQTNAGLEQTDSQWINDLINERASDFETVSAAYHIAYREAVEGMSYAEYYRKAQEPGSNYIFLDLALNKRRQIEAQRGESLLNATFKSLSEQGRKNKSFRTVLVNDQTRDWANGKDAENTDGAAYISPELMREIVVHAGMDSGRTPDELPSSVKPFAFQRGGSDGMGQFMVKAAFHQASAAQVELMKKHGIDMLIYESGAKASGSRQFYDLTETNDSATLTLNGEEVAPEIYDLHQSSITVNPGNYDNPKNIRKDTRIPLQFFQNILPKDRQAMLDLYEQAFIREGSEWAGESIHNEKVAALYRLFMSSGPEIGLQLEREIIDSIDIDKVGMRELLSVAYHLNGIESQLYSKVMAKILNETREPLEELGDLSEEELDLDRIMDSFQNTYEEMTANKGADIYYRMAGTTGIKPADRISKPGFNYFEKVLKTFVAKRLFRPKLQGTMKSIMLPNTESHGFVREGAFRLGKGAKKRMVRWGDELIELGDAWDEFQLAGGWDSAPEWMQERMTMMTMRSPAPTIGAIRVLQFDGFLDTTGTGVQFHHYDMKYQGGADLDIDSAFVFTDVPESMKKVVSRPEYKWQWNEGFRRDGKFIPEKSLTDLFVAQDSVRVPGSIKSMLSSTDQWKLNVRAKIGKDLLEQSLGFGKRIHKWYPELEQREDITYGKDTERSLDLRFEDENQEFKPFNWGYDNAESMVQNFQRPGITNPNTQDPSSQLENTTVSVVDLFNNAAIVGMDDPKVPDLLDSFLRNHLWNDEIRFRGQEVDPYDAPMLWRDLYWTMDIRKGREHEIEQLIRQATNFAADSANYEQLKSFDDFRRNIFNEIFDGSSIRWYAKGRNEESIEITKQLNTVIGEDFLLDYVGRSDWEGTSPALRAINQAVKLLDTQTMYTRNKRSERLLFNPHDEPKYVTIGSWGQQEVDTSLHHHARSMHDILQSAQELDVPYRDIINLFHSQLYNMQLMNGEQLRDSRLTEKQYIFERRVTEDMPGALQYGSNYEEMFEANQAFGALNMFGKAKPGDYAIKPWEMLSAFGPKSFLDGKRQFDLLVGTKDETNRDTRLKNLDEVTELQEDVLAGLARRRLSVGSEITDIQEVYPRKPISEQRHRALEALLQSKALHEAPDYKMQINRRRQSILDQQYKSLDPVYEEYRQEQLGVELTAQDLADMTSAYLLYPKYKDLQSTIAPDFINEYRDAVGLSRSNKQAIKKFVHELASEATMFRQLAQQLSTPVRDRADFFDMLDSMYIEGLDSGYKMQSVVAKAFSQYLKNKTRDIYGFADVKRNVNRLNLQKELRRFIRDTIGPNGNFIDLYLAHAESQEIFERKRLERIEYELSLNDKAEVANEALNNGQYREQAILQRNLEDRTVNNVRVTRDGTRRVLDHSLSKRTFRERMSERPELITNKFRDAVNDYMAAYYVSSLYPQAQGFDQYARFEQQEVRDVQNLIRKKNISPEEREALTKLWGQKAHALKVKKDEWYKTYLSVEPTQIGNIDPGLMREWINTNRAVYRSFTEGLSDFQVRAILKGAKLGNVLNMRNTEVSIDPTNSIAQILGITEEDFGLDSQDKYVEYSSDQLAAMLDEIEHVNESAIAGKVMKEVEWLTENIEGREEEFPEASKALEQIEELIRELKNDKSFLGIPLQEMTRDTVEAVSTVLKAMDVPPSIKRLVVEFNKYFLKRAQREAFNREQQKLGDYSDRALKDVFTTGVFRDRKLQILDREQLLDKQTEFTNEQLQEYEQFAKEGRKQWVKTLNADGTPKSGRDKSGRPVWIEGVLYDKERERRGRIKTFFDSLKENSNTRKNILEETLANDRDQYERVRWLREFLDRNPHMAVNFKQKFLGVLYNKIKYSGEAIPDYKYASQAEVNTVIDWFRTIDEKGILPEVKPWHFIVFPDMVGDVLLPHEKMFQQTEVLVRKGKNIELQRVLEPLSHIHQLKGANDAMNRAMSQHSWHQSQSFKKIETWVEKAVGKKEAGKYFAFANKRMLLRHYDVLLEKLDQEIQENPLEHLESSKKVLLDSRNNLSDIIEKSSQFFEKKFVDRLIDDQIKFIKQQLVFNKDDIVKPEYDTLWSKGKKIQVMNTRKTLDLIHQFVVRNGRIPDIGINKIKELRNQIILENMEVDLGNMPKNVISSLPSKYRKRPVRRMSDLAGESFYPKLYAHIKNRILKQQDYFAYIDADTFFPIHGYTEGQKLAAVEEIVRRHNQVNLDESQFTRASSQWVNDLIRYVGYEGGSNALSGSALMSGNLIKDQYKVNQLHGIQGLIDPNEGRHLLYLTPHIIGVDTGRYTLKNWADSITRTKEKALFSIYANWITDNFSRSQRKALKGVHWRERQLYLERIEAWENWFRIYIRQASGRASYIPQAARDNASFQIGKLALKFSETGAIDKILDKDDTDFLKEYSMDRDVSNKEIQHLVNTERGIRVLRKQATNRALSELEARYEIMSLLFHPKVWMGNIIGGGTNIMVQQGIKPLRRSFDYKWLQKNVDPSIRNEESLFAFAQKWGVENSELSQEVDYAGNDRSGQFVQSNRYTVIDAVEKISRGKGPEAVVKVGATFIQHSEKILRGHAFMSSYIHAMEVLNVNKANHREMRPMLVHMANRSVELTQFLYDNGNRPLIAATPLGKTFFRFKLWLGRSMWRVHKMYKLQDMYGFKPGTQGYSQLKRWLVAAMFTQMLAETLPFSIFDSAKHPAVDYLSDLAGLLFGDENERSRTFFGWGEHGLPGAVYGTLAPTFMRLPNAVAQIALSEGRGSGKYGSPFEKDIAKNLERNGYVVKSQVEVDGYLIDLAIKDPRTGKYVMVIEADGVSYHSGAYKKKKDKQRQAFLESKGFDFYRVRSDDWFDDPEYELQRMIAYINNELRRSQIDDPSSDEYDAYNMLNDKVFFSLFTGEYRKLADYHLWNAMPFGRAARSLIHPFKKSSHWDTILDDGVNQLTGIPVKRSYSELREWFSEAKEYQRLNKSLLYN